MSEPNLYAFLSGIPEISALVADRIYQNTIPQKVRDDPDKVPCAVILRSGGERQRLFCGTDNLVQGTYTIDCEAPDFDDAVALADAIRRALVDYSGLMGTVRVDTVMMATDFDAGIVPDPGLYNRTDSYSIFYFED